MDFKTWGVLALLASMLATGGCSTLRGAPEPLLARRQVNGDKIVDAERQVKALLEATALESRNAAQAKLMALADLRYVQYRNDLVNSRRGTRTSAGMVTLFADVAATLTTSVAVKDNYIALSALVAGSEAVVDKEYLFDKTIDSLIARMDADRKAKQLAIYRRHQDVVENYTGQSALADVIEYYSLGTLNSALISVNKTVQAGAEKEQKASEEELKSLLSPQGMANREATNRMERFVKSLNRANMDKLAAFLKQKGIDVATLPAAGDPQAELLQGLVVFRTNQRVPGKTDAQAEADSVAALQQAGFQVPD
jgi:hypothetical protein